MSEGVKVDERGNVTVFAPAAQSGARSVAPKSAPKLEDEPLSIELGRVVRHLNGLAVAVESLREKVLAYERAGKFNREPTS